MSDQRFKILIVEDEETLRSGLAELLRLDGFEVLTRVMARMATSRRSRPSRI